MTVPLAFQSPLLTTIWWMTLIDVFLPETVMSKRLTSGAGAVKEDCGPKMVVVFNGEPRDHAGVFCSVDVPVDGIW